MEDYLDIEQASKHLNKSVKTLRRWVHLQKIPYRVDRGKYYFSLDDLAARRSVAVDPMNNSALLERIECLEMALQSFSERLEALEHQAPVSSPATVPARPPALRPTRLVSNGSLPDGLVALAVFADAHNIAPSTSRKAAESGRLPVTRGKWKHGRVYVETALDPAQQSGFIALFRGNPGFKPCVVGCPDIHTV